MSDAEIGVSCRRPEENVPSPEGEIKLLLYESAVLQSAGEMTLLGQMPTPACRDSFKVGNSQ